MVYHSIISLYVIVSLSVLGVNESGEVSRVRVIHTQSVATPVCVCVCVCVCF